MTLAPPRARPAVQQAAVRRRRTRAASLRHFTGFAAPGLLVYLCFVLAPILLSVGYSLTNFNQFRPPTKFVGLDNYLRLLTDAEFIHSIRVTATIALMVVIIPNVAGLLIAMLLDRSAWFYRVMRTVFFVPVVLSSVVVSVMWTRMLSDDGLVNTGLRALGVDSPPGWLRDPDLAVYSIGVIISWQVLGFCVVVYLAGLQGVPRELHEAAHMDGAGPFKRFASVTWPMLAPALTVNTVMMLIEGFKTFDHIKVITNGGPGSGTTATLSFSIIETGLTANRTGAASAMAIVMLVLVAALSAFVLRLLKRREVDL